MKIMSSVLGQTEFNEVTDIQMEMPINIALVLELIVLTFCVPPQFLLFL